MRTSLDPDATYADAVIHGDGLTSLQHRRTRGAITEQIESAVKDVVEKAVFRDVRIIRPAKEGFVPYRDYIGSLLEILDLSTPERTSGTTTTTCSRPTERCWA